MELKHFLVGVAMYFLAYLLGRMDGKIAATSKRANETEVEIKVIDAANDVCELSINGEYIGRMPLREALKYSFEREERDNGRKD